MPNSPDDKRATDRSVNMVRETDIEPYTALRWVGTLFKAAAIFLAVALVGEFIAGLRVNGASFLPELLGSMARTVVLAVLMWGGGDLVRLMVQLGNDVRAERILLSRLVHRTPPLADAGPEPTGEVSSSEDDFRSTRDADRRTA
jgi:hypothetical protein